MHEASASSAVRFQAAHGQPTPEKLSKKKNGGRLCLVSREQALEGIPGMAAELGDLVAGSTRGGVTYLRDLGAGVYMSSGDWKCTKWKKPPPPQILLTISE